MGSLGATHLLVLLAFVVLVLDSRRLRTLTRTPVRGRRAFTAGHGIPAGTDPDRVGLPLRQIQMRVHVDWQDGGIGWDGPEVLPVDDPDDVWTPTETPPALPVLWNPFPALPAAGETGHCNDGPVHDGSRLPARAGR